MTSTKKPLPNNNSLVGKNFLNPLSCNYRQLPTAAAKEAFDLMKTGVPSVESHPHTFAWYCLVDRFHESVRGSWAAAAPAKGAEKKPVAKKEEVKVVEEVKPAVVEEEDELDLFGDEEPTEVSLIYI